MNDNDTISQEDMKKYSDEADAIFEVFQEESSRIINNLISERNGGFNGNEVLAVLTSLELIRLAFANHFMCIDHKHGDQIKIWLDKSRMAANMIFLADDKENMSSLFH